MHLQSALGHSESNVPVVGQRVQKQAEKDVCLLPVVPCVRISPVYHMPFHVSPGALFGLFSERDMLC